MNQSPLQLQPVIALLLEVSDRMLTEKIGRDLFLRRLACQRFDAVLAELEDMPMIVRARPGTALTIEAVLLVDLEPIADPAGKTCLAKRETQTLG